MTETLTSSGPSSSFLDPADTTAASSSDLQVHHVPLPASYLTAAWPLLHVAVSCDGSSDIAVAGRQGLLVFNRRQDRWRMFGDVSQVRGGGVWRILHECMSLCVALGVYMWGQGMFEMVQAQVEPCGGLE